MPRLVFKLALFNHPVVQRAVRLVLQRTERMRDPFNRVLNRVREIVHGINAPLVPRLMMRDVQDAVKRGVAQVDVRGGHVDPGAERAAAVRELAVLHAGEQVQVFLHAAFPPGGVFAGFGQCAAVFAHLILGEVVHVRNALFDELYGKRITGVEIFRAEAQLVPVEPQPMDVVLDCVNVFHIFLGGVGVVKAQITFATELFGH